MQIHTYTNFPPLFFVRSPHTESCPSPHPTSLPLTPPRDLQLPPPLVNRSYPQHIHFPSPSPSHPRFRVSPLHPITPPIAPPPSPPSPASSSLPRGGPSQHPRHTQQPTAPPPLSSDVRTQRTHGSTPRDQRSGVGGRGGGEEGGREGRGHGMVGRAWRGAWRG